MLDQSIISIRLQAEVAVSYFYWRRPGSTVRCSKRFHLRGLESASEKRSTMSSQETLGASSSRGTAIRLEAATGTGNPGDPIEDVGIALGQPIATADDFKLEFFQKIDDPKGDYKVQVLGCGAPQHVLPNPPVPDLDSDLCKKIVAEIIEQFYEKRFKQLEDDLED